MRYIQDWYHHIYLKLQKLRLKIPTSFSGVVIALLLIFTFGAGSFAVINTYRDNDATVNLNEGLIGQWDFEGDANDKSTYSNHGDVNGAVLTTGHDDESNSAYEFDGSDDYLRVDDTNYTNHEEWSFSIWINSDDTIDGNNIAQPINKASAYDSTNSSLFQFNWDHSTAAYQKAVVMRDESNTWHAAQISDSLSTGVWYHIVGTWDGDTLKVFLDGVEKDSNPLNISGQYFNDDPLFIGSGFNTSGNPFSFFDGKIDNVRIYSRALNSSEVTTLYYEDIDDNPVSIASTQGGLVGHWKLDGNANDSSAYSHGGTVNGAILTTDRNGQSNKAYSFDGTDDYIQISSSDELETPINNQWSMSAWIKPNSTGTNPEVIVRKNTSGNGYFMRLDNGNEFVSLLNFSGGYTTQNGGEFEYDKWQLATVTYDGSTWKHYINGKEVGSWTHNDTLTFNTSPIRIGSNNTTTEHFNGDIDDVRIYNRSLTASEVLRLYDEYNPGIKVSNLQKGLIAHYKLDESQAVLDAGGDVVDRTPYSNHGTPTTLSSTVDRNGASGRAFSFNGTNDYVSTSSDNFNNPEVSFSFWMKKNEGTSGHIVNKYAGTKKMWGVIVSGVNSISIYENIDDGGVTNYSGSIGSGWHHVVAAMDSSNEQFLYIDGVLVGSGSVASTEYSKVEDNIYLGQRGDNSNYFNGDLDDMRVYNRVLTEVEAKALYEGYQ